MKKDLSTVHPQLLAAARLLPDFTFNGKKLDALNQLMRFYPGGTPPADIRVENTLIARGDSQQNLRLRVYRPINLPKNSPALLWFHGGGFVMGSPEQDDACCIQYARELHISVISVAYRLAPQHPFPAALEDASTALSWLASSACPLSPDRERIALGGDSAGGGLAAALAQRTFDCGEVRPAFQLLIYPMLDDRTLLRPGFDEAHYFVWNQASNRYAWESYLGQKCGQANPAPYAVPARRSDLAGLPPAWIGVGSLDMFYEEDLAYAERLRSSGVPCEVLTVPGAFHGFDVIDAHLPIVREFRAAQINALKQYLLP